MTGLAIVFTVLCPILGAVFVYAYEKQQHRRAFWLKGLAGLCFVAAGLSLAIERAGAAFPRLIVFGLVLGLVGDELLALRHVWPERRDAFFASGTAAFAAGHVCYLRAMWELDGGAWLFALVLLAFGLAAAAGYILRRDAAAGRLLVPGLAYIALVVFVAAMAAALLVRGQGTKALLLTLGGICFAVSDSVLCTLVFGLERTTRKNIFIHATYYAAQLLIAWSIAAYNI